MKHILVTYDIERDKVRRRIATILEGHGERVQYSVFECQVTASQYRKLKQLIHQVIDQQSTNKADKQKGESSSNRLSIRFYSFCTRCAQQVEIMGEGTAFPEDPDYYLV